MSNYIEEDDPAWNEEKLIAFVIGFGKEMKHNGRAIKGKSGKIVPTEKFISYIKEAFRNCKKEGPDETLFDSV